MKYNWGPSIIIDPLDIFHKTKLYQKIFFMSVYWAKCDWCLRKCVSSEAQVVCRSQQHDVSFQIAKIMIFWHFAHNSDFHSLFFFGRQKRLIKGWNLFWISSTTLIKTYGTWSTPPLHNLALSPHRSWFFKNSICRFSTFKSNLGILTLSECHEILDGGSTRCKEATVKILSKSDKVKGGKSLSQCMK